MFLNALVERNPSLVRTAAELHRRGELLPNTYVLDLDAIEANARSIAAEADRLRLTVYAMTKQIGRCPPALRAIEAGGIDRFVAVDVGCALPIAGAGHRIGHVGHVVQIPRGDARRIARMRPSHWTAYSADKAREAAAASTEEGHVQSLLARVHAPDDRFYPGQEGGFPAAEIEAVAEDLDALDGARFGGVATFPAVLFDPESGSVKPAPNARTLIRAAEAVRGAWPDVEVNAPGTTSTRVLPILAELGATQVEPGHGLTGTTPWHAVDSSLPELPSVLYLSEVSHEHAGWAYCFGGGLYIDPVLGTYEPRVLAGRDPDALLDRQLEAKLPPIEGIDYYGMIRDDAWLETGDTVIWGFRPQAFITRAFVAPIRGVGTGSPKVEGIWTTDGRPAGWSPEQPLRSATS